MRATTAILAVATMIGGSVFAQAGKPAGGGTVPAKHDVAAAGQVDLRPRFKAGQQHRFKVLFDAVSTQSLPDAGEPTQTNSQEIGLLLRVKDVDAETAGAGGGGGGATLELVYESLKVKMSLPIGEVDFDSAKPKGDYAEIFGPLVGLTLTVKTDRDGNITSVSSGDSLTGASAAIAGQLTGSDVVKNMFGPIVSVRKGKGLASVGDTWTNEDVIQSPFGDVRVATTNRLRSARGSQALIDIKGAFSLAKRSEASPVSVKDSSLAGQATWDTDAGILDSLELKQRVSLETRGAEGKAASMKSELTLKVTRTKP